MVKLHVITDSGACFSNPRLLQQYPVTTVPYRIKLGGQTVKEGQEISQDEIIRLIRAQNHPPQIMPPSVQDFVDALAPLSRAYDGVLVITTSREMNESWFNAQKAAQQLGDSANIAVIDSETVCAGQGMLVRVAGQAALDQLSFEEAVQRVRGAIDRIFSAYYVESLNYLQHNQIMSESHTILGSLLGIKPFISIESGKLVVTEKVKTRSQAIDRLIEFLTEFDNLDDAMIVQNRSHITEQARVLQDRLSVEFPGRHFPYTMYGVVLGALLGPDVIGVVVLESAYDEMDFDDD